MRVKAGSKTHNPSKVAWYCSPGPVASLGLVSPGTATDWCHPIFFFQRNWRPLLAVASGEWWPPRGDTRL